MTKIGRKSGKKRRIPLSSHRNDNIITIFSARGEESSWMKNIHANPESVWVRHGFHSFQARIEFVIDKIKTLNIIKWYVVKHSKSAKMIFGWNSKTDDPETTDFTNLLYMISIIRFYPKLE